jgi:tetratricopeptide (TPR) repeat protein
MRPAAAIRSPAAARPRRRRSLLDAASAALARGRVKKAIREYLQLLAQAPNDPAVHAHVAPLLAKQKQLVLARQHFEAAGQLFQEQGFVDKAIGVYRSAVTYLPRDRDFWVDIARLYRERGYKAEAVKTLLQGRKRFHRRANRQEAIHLLRMAFEIEPWHYDVTRHLARMLVKSGAHAEARGLYEGLAARVQGARLTSVRFTQFYAQPTPAAFWRWVRSIFRQR